jgi:hypothetical protein
LPAEIIKARKRAATLNSGQSSRKEQKKRVDAGRRLTDTGTILITEFLMGELATDAGVGASDASRRKAA